MAAYRFLLCLYVPEIERNWFRGGSAYFELQICVPLFPVGPCYPKAILYTRRVAHRMGTK